MIYRPNFSTQIGAKKKISRDSAACVWQIQPTSSQSLKFINLVSDVIFINVLLQCNISLNPGPNQHGLLCQFCNKHIGRSQENAQCSKCNLYYHLRYLDTEYEQSKLCHLCGILNPSNDSTYETMFSFIAMPDELVNFVKCRGLKIIHQNVQSLRSKIVVHIIAKWNTYFDTQ